jgi:putative endonuclease
VTTQPTTTKALGDAAEARALAHLAAAGLVLVRRNYRVARGPRARRRRGRPGDARPRRHARLRRGPGPSRRTVRRRRRQHRLATPPPCRFDVVAVDGERIEWLRAAFDAG